MLNFGSMFSPSRNYQSLSEALSTPNVSLMRLLDEQSFISQFRSPGPQIKEYMTYTKWLQLVQLVTQVGDPFDKKRSYKFPLTTADLLSSENAFVFDKLLPQQGIIVEQEKVVQSVQQEIEQQIDDDDEDDEDNPNNNQAQPSNLQTNQVQAKTEEKAQIAQDEEFGQFVVAPVKKKKIVKIKEVVETVTIVKKQYPSLVNKILDYFGNEVNYTLTSYCCKILTSLLNKRTSKFLTYFFETYSNSNRNIFKHIESRSTVQFLTRVFTIQTKDNLQGRLKLFKQLLQYSSQPHQLQVLSNISATLCETFEKLNAHFKTNNPCKQLQAYFNLIPQYLPLTVSNIISQHENVSVYSAPFIFQLLSSLPQELDNQSIDKILQPFVEGAILKLSQAIESKKDRLGVGRVKIIEIFNFILKRSKIKELISGKAGFLPLIISIIKAYPLNNIVHNQAFKLISYFVSSQTQHQYAQNALISWLKEEAQAQKQRIENGISKKLKGYNAHLINLCKNFREGNNPIIKQFTLSLQYFDIIKFLAEKEIIKNQRNLGGFSKISVGPNPQKTTKSFILFSKEQILKQHQKFLSNAKPPTFEADPDDPFQNQQELEELQRQLDGIQMEDTPPKSEEVIEQEKHKAELIEQNEQHHSAFWKVHLEYNIESLMEQLL